MVEFVSYDGDWPCLCSGTLIIKVNGKDYSLENVLISGGFVTHDADWNFDVSQGEWDIDLRYYPELEEYKDEIVKVVNKNVHYGCCGGCI